MTSPNKSSVSRLTAIHSDHTEMSVPIVGR